MSKIKYFIAWSFINMSENRYGITFEEYCRMKKDPLFCENKDVVKLSKYARLTATLITIGMFLGIGLFTLLILLSFLGSLNLRTYNDKEIVVDSLLYWKYKNVEVGNPNYDYEFDIMGYLTIPFGIVAIAVYNLGFYYFWKITDLNSWEGSIFYEHYRKQYQTREDNKIKAWRITSLITNIIGSLLFLVAIFIPLKVIDITDYVVNFNSHAGPFGSYISVDVTNIPLISVSAIALLMQMISLGNMYMLEFATYMNFQTAIISIFRSGNYKSNDEHSDTTNYSINNKDHSSRIRSAYVFDDDAKEKDGRIR